jgi:hypothetical protein
MKVFVEELAKFSTPLRKTLEPVCLLFGILKLIESETSLFEQGILKGNHFKWAKEVRDELIFHISGYALGLVEVNINVFNDFRHWVTKMHSSKQQLGSRMARFTRHCSNGLPKKTQSMTKLSNSSVLKR